MNVLLELIKKSVKASTILEKRDIEYLMACKNVWGWFMALDDKTALKLDLKEYGGIFTEVEDDTFREMITTAKALGCTVK